MPDATRRPDKSDDAALLALLDAISLRDHAEVARQLDATPLLATRTIQAGATRESQDGYFLLPIRRHVYRGDTALHLAAAAHQRGIAESLVAGGAGVCVRN